MASSRGRAPSPDFNSHGPRPTLSPSAPQAIVRYLYSCGYRCPDKVERTGGWVKARVVHRDTGVEMGVRWVRVREAPERGYETRSTDPRLDGVARNLKRARAAAEPADPDDGDPSPPDGQ